VLARQPNTHEIRTYNDRLQATNTYKELEEHNKTLQEQLRRQNEDLAEMKSEISHLVHINQKQNEQFEARKRAEIEERAREQAQIDARISKSRSRNVDSEEAASSCFCRAALES